ncbi:RWP-RK domain-containing protein [Citrus sinensis]|uniref:RWP-RK domain-containing protein n=1 Tax=Citrus sinensis TaxID=2711 RepID=A0ACB8P3Z1_CITSI|nr:RWP-RK domain-containing protein [Citrus sinensis]
MADPRAIVPYHDPHDNSYTEDIFNFINNPNPTFADLSLFEEPSSIPHSTNNPQSGGIITDAGDPFDDPLFWDIGNNCNAGSFQAGPSGNQAEMSDRGTPAIENAANMKAFPRWPVPPEPYLCSCCLVLREIIHTNGHGTTKLEIHGRLGLICHAILEIRQCTNASQHYMIDFCKKSIENVKEYLVQYCEDRKQAGFMMLPDPLSDFYEAVCVGLDLDDNLTTDDYSQPPMTNSGENEMHQPDMENEAERTTRTSLSAQAARRMKLCPTVVKKICRRDGLHRWPHRKIKSIQRRMSVASGRLRSNDAEERANAQIEIQRLQEEMAAACAGLTR